MVIDGELIPTWLSGSLWLLLVATCLLALRYADWRAVTQVPARLHLLLGGALFCVVLWLLSVRVIPGLWLHFLGITTLTLILGWRFAVLSGTLAVLVHTALIGQGTASIPTAWLLSVAVPATVSRYLVFRLRKLKFRNLFIYMLGAGFGGGILSVLALAATALPLFWVIDQRAWVTDALSNWPLISLLLFPEGFINGMVVTTLTVFYPQLVKTFDERHYLDDG
jgi:uncharacterized membrane protein